MTNKPDQSQNKSKQITKTGPDKTELTPAQWETIGRYAAFNLSMSAAAKAVGLSPKTIQRRLNEQGKTWNDFKAENRESVVFMLISKLLQNALKNNNLGAQIFALKNLAGWSDNAQPVENVDERPPITYEIVPKKAREELKKITVEKKVVNGAQSNSDNRKK